MGRTTLAYLVLFLLTLCGGGLQPAGTAQPNAPAQPRQAAELIPLTPEGMRLARVLDAMDVENHWLPADHITDWRTGEPDGKAGGPRTHCSLFVAAVCWKLHAPMLDPPPQTFLSNRQQDWLLKEGKDKGWTELRDGVDGQRLANRGVLVVASYRNPNPKKAGHIAVLHPAPVSLRAVAADGPRITQAGAHNYRETDVENGFKNHRGAWQNGEIHFFAYQPPGK